MSHFGMFEQNGGFINDIRNKTCYKDKSNFLTCYASHTVDDAALLGAVICDAVDRRCPE